MRAWRPTMTAPAVVESHARGQDGFAALLHDRGLPAGDDRHLGVRGAQIDTDDGVVVRSPGCRRHQPSSLTSVHRDVGKTQHVVAPHEPVPQLLDHDAVADPVDAARLNRVHDPAVEGASHGLHGPHVEPGQHPVETDDRQLVTFDDARGAPQRAPEQPRPIPQPDRGVPAPHQSVAHFQGLQQATVLGGSGNALLERGQRLVAALPPAGGGVVPLRRGRQLPARPGLFPVLQADLLPQRGELGEQIAQVAVARVRFRVAPGVPRPPYRATDGSRRGRAASSLLPVHSCSFPSAANRVCKPGVSRRAGRAFTSASSANSKSP